MTQRKKRFFAMLLVFITVITGANWTVYATDNIDLRFYNSAGTLLTVEENTGNVNKTVVLVGTKYYMRVCNKNSSVTGTYTLNING